MKTMMLYLNLALISILLTTQVFAEKRVDIGLFSQQATQGWKQKIYSGETRYSIVPIGNKSVLSADSQHSASAFYRSIEIDLDQTPVLNWSWFNQQFINPGNEADKSGDDFVARVYIIKSGGLLPWNARAINYVWSYQHAKGETWDNPFAGDKAKMVSVRDATHPEGKWFTEKRNIVEDFARLFGKKIHSIDGIAIMTDSDNSAKAASALYGDIYFTAE